MFNIQDFKNGTTLGDNFILLVDDINDKMSFGFTDSIEKVTYNMKTIEPALSRINFKEDFEKSTKGITTAFPLGRFITILEVKKDNSHMSMTLFDFRIGYAVIEEAFKNVISENILNQIKRIKYEYEDLYNDSFDIFELNTFLQPQSVE